MATVDKNFKVKHGLVVEGNTATVNGSDVITANAIASGTQNNITVNYDANSKTLNFSVDALTIDTLGPLSYNNGVLDLVTGQGLTVGPAGDLLVDTNALANLIAGTGLYPAGGGEIAVSDQFVIDTIEAANALTLNTSGNLNTSGSVSASNIDASTAISVAGNTVVLNGNGVTVFGKELASKEYVDGQVPDNTDGLTEGSTNLYFTASRAVTANEGLWDASGSAANALTSAQSYTDSRINDGVTSNVKTWSSTKINSEISTAVSGLVDGAPDLLNTLNELAAAIGDDENYATTVANLVAAKQDSFGAAEGLSFDTDPLSNNSILKVNVDGNTIGIANDALYVDTSVMATKGYVDGEVGTKQDSFTAGDGLLFIANNQTLAVLYGDGLTVNTTGLIVDTNTIASVEYVDTNFVSAADLPGQLDDYVPLTQKGANDGVATLNSTGQVPVSQLKNVNDALDATNGGGSVWNGVGYIMSSGAYYAQIDSTQAVVGQKQWYTTVIETSSALSGTFPVYGVSNKLTISAVDSAGAVHTEEVLVVADSNSNVNITEYAIITTGDSLFDIDIQSVSSPWSNANKNISFRLKRANAATSGNKVSITVGVEALWYSTK